MDKSQIIMLKEYRQKEYALYNYTYTKIVLTLELIFSERKQIICWLGMGGAAEELQKNTRSFTY